MAETILTIKYVGFLEKRERKRKERERDISSE